MSSGISAEIRELAEQRSMLCKVFSNAQRVLILWFLIEGERTVSEIAHAIEASLPSTSQHLRLMELLGILESHRESHNIYYRLIDNELLHDCMLFTNPPSIRLKEAAFDT